MDRWELQGLGPPQELRGPGQHSYFEHGQMGATGTRAAPGAQGTTEFQLLESRDRQELEGPGKLQEVQSKAIV